MRQQSATRERKKKKKKGERQSEGGGLAREIRVAKSDARTVKFLTDFVEAAGGSWDTAPFQPRGGRHDQRHAVKWRGTE